MKQVSRLVLGLLVAAAGGAALAQGQEPQSSLSFNVGVTTDYRFRGTPLTLGGNVNWVPGTTTRLDAEQTSTTSTKAAAISAHAAAFAMLMKASMSALSGGPAVDHGSQFARPDPVQRGGAQRHP